MKPSLLIRPILLLKTLRLNQSLHLIKPPPIYPSPNRLHLTKHPLDPTNPLIRPYSYHHSTPTNLTISSDVPPHTNLLHPSFSSLIQTSHHSPRYKHGTIISSRLSVFHYGSNPLLKIHYTAIPLLWPLPSFSMIHPLASFYSLLYCCRQINTT